MSTVHASRRQEDRDRARSRILAAATALFYRHGIDRVTFGAVAKKARLSRPLVYFYFPDKRTLFVEACLLAGQQLAGRFVAASTGAPTGLDAVEAIGRAYVAFQEEEPALFFLLMAHTPADRAKLTGDSPEACMVQQELAVMNLVTDSVKRGIADGSIRPDVGDPLTVALCLWGFTHGLAQLGATQRATIEDFHGTPIARFRDTGFQTLRRSLQAGV